ncbi:MAG: hypothetical protein ABF289_10655, partial [Clostridiales bacterium]
VKKNFSNKIYIVLSISLLITSILYTLKYIKNINYKVKFIVLKIFIAFIILILLFIKPISLFSRMDTFLNKSSTIVFETITKYIYISDGLEVDESNKSKIKEEENRNMIILASSMWNHYIHTPWRIMEFGNAELADKAEYKILKYSPNDSKRLDIIKQIEQGKGEFKDFKGYKSEELPEKRLGFMLMYFAPVIINFLVIATICLLIIGCHFIILFMLLMGVFIIAISVGRKVNTDIIKDWAYRMVKLIITKFALISILIITLSINNVLLLYTSQSQMGWIFGLLIQIGLYAIIYWTKLSFMDFIKIRLNKKSELVLGLIGNGNKNLREPVKTDYLEDKRKIRHLLGDGSGGIINQNEKRVDQILLTLTYGPYLKRDGSSISTFLILAVNNSNNKIISGEFYLNKSIDTFSMVFNDSVERIGIPNKLILESNKIINSKTFNNLSKEKKFLIVKLDDKIKTDIDNIVRNLRNEFLKDFSLNRLKSIDQLNLDLKKWIETSKK